MHRIEGFPKKVERFGLKAGLFILNTTQKMVLFGSIDLNVVKSLFLTQISLYQGVGSWFHKFGSIGQIKPVFNVFPKSGS